MRKGRVKTGLRLMIAAVLLLLLGAFYNQQISALFSVAADGSFEFVRLSFLWGFILGFWGVIIFIVGLVQRSVGHEPVRVLPTFLMFVGVIILFLTLFYRSLTQSPASQPLKPGETVII